MSFVSTRVSRSVILLCACLFSVAASAQMQAMDDDELAAVSGQGLINLDALTYGGYEFTRLNIGGDIKLLTNIDKLRMGNYARSGGGTVSNQPADIAIDNFALGRVDNASTPGAAIVPFEIRDPYIELAFKNNGAGVREVAGIRLGFGRARGDLSGDFHSMTGVMEGYVNGPASIAREYYMQTNNLNSFTCTFNFNCLALSIAGDAELYSKVQLVKAGTGDVMQNGQPINRATQMGVANGDSFQTDNATLKPLLPLLATNNGDCKATGLPACFDLLNYKSIFVGDRVDSNLATGGAQGIFFSVQGQNVPWQDLANAGKFVNTQAGAFANFAKYNNADGKAIYPFAIALFDALRGAARVDTCVGGTGC